MASYTHYWQNDTCDFQRDSKGAALAHTASNQFRARGVSPGSHVYVVTVRQGILFLIGRMEVGQIVSKRQAERVLNYPVWDAEEHLIASKGTGTKMIFNRSVPVTITEQLLFEKSGKFEPPVFKAPGRLDQQTLRGVRKLNESSAALLEACIVDGHKEKWSAKDAPIAGIKAEVSSRKQKSSAPYLDFESDTELAAFEGERRVRFVTHRVREARLREAKLSEALRDSPDGRLRCQVSACGFDFEEAYGVLGREFIEVHHLEPMSSREEPTITSLNELALVCANCHRMIHRGGRSRPLQDLIRRRI